MDRDTAAGCAVLLPVAIGLLILAPWIAFWAVNTIFGTHLVVSSFKVWLAAVLILGLLNGSGVRSGK